MLYRLYTYNIADNMYISDVHFIVCSGQFERPRGRLNDEEVPQDLLCAENVKNPMENFSFDIDSIPSSKRLSDFYEEILQR